MLILKTVITTFDALLMLLLFLLARESKKDEGYVVFTTMFIALFMANIFAMWR